jgi:hypothetical protein
MALGETATLIFHSPVIRLVAVHGRAALASVTWALNPPIDPGNHRRPGTGSYSRVVPHDNFP